MEFKWETKAKSHNSYVAVYKFGFRTGGGQVSRGKRGEEVGGGGEVDKDFKGL